jgi:hypothetical protein
VLFGGFAAMSLFPAREIGFIAPIAEETTSQIVRLRGQRDRVLALRSGSVTGS